MMIWMVYFAVVSFAGASKNDTDCLLGTATVPQQPQLSLTFIQGYWYEHLYTSNLLQNETCSHFEIRCNVSEKNCLILHQKWEGYLLDKIWNGTIAQQNNSVQLTIIQDDGSSQIYKVNIKFAETALLIWSCKNEMDLLFASTLYRMEEDDQMKNIWEEAATDWSYPDIIQDTPAGIWAKIDPGECLNGGAFKYAPKLLVALALVLGVIARVRNP